MLFVGPLGVGFSGISIEINIFSFGKMHLRMSSGVAVVLSRSQCVNTCITQMMYIDGYV